MMRECWQWYSRERPTFNEIVQQLDRILCSCSNEEYLDLGLPQQETPPTSDEESDDENESKEKFKNLL